MKTPTKLKYVVLGLALFFTTWLQAQSSYDDYSSSEKTFEYREDFNSSSIYWDTDEPGRRTAKIEDGQLVFKSLNDKTQVKYTTIDLDWASDWELEIGVRWVQGKETSAVDFIWDKASGESDKFHFGFTGGGKYVLAEYKNSAYDHIIKFQASSIVNKYSSNKLTVRKVDQKYYLFFNEKLVKTMAYKPVKGDMVGFTVPPGSTIKVDFLHAVQLEKYQTPDTSYGTRGGYSAYTNADKTRVYREDFTDNSGNWEAYESAKRIGKVNDGVYDWVSLNDNAQMKTHVLSSMDWGRDWQIEIRMRHVTGKTTSSNDLLLDISSSNERYHFGFTSSGKYNLSKKTSSGYERIVAFTESSIVNKTGFNKLTVRKLGGRYEYYFNERLITTQYDQGIDNDKLGFMVPPNSTLQVDYLEVAYLKSPSNANITEGGYYGVMTKYNGYNLQRWKTRDNFPKDDIKKDWDDGFYVTDASYDNGKWSLITSKGTGYTTQNWITRNDWPKDEIKEKWDLGFQMTEVNYGNGVYAIVFSKGSGYERQRWSTRSTFPTEKIKEYGDDGLRLTELIYGNDRWVLVGSRDSRIQRQKWFKRKEFPRDAIDQYLNEGFAITQLSRENGWWVLIMSKYNSSKPTVWFNTANFPKEEIRKYWDQGYYLTDITHYQAPQSTEVSRDPAYSVKYKPANPTEVLVGKWFGGSKTDTDDEKGYFKFNDDGIVAMTADGETIGGYDYEISGTKITLTYEVSSGTNYDNINLIFGSGGTEFGRMKGIIRFIDRDSFEIKIASELNDPRPKDFSDNTGNDVALFKRVD